LGLRNRTCEVDLELLLPTLSRRPRSSEPVI